MKIKKIAYTAAQAIIGFPNFAYYKYRLMLGFSGKLPVSQSLPFEWYDTPNIHLVTLRDFKDLCQKHGIAIHALECLTDSGLGKLLLALGFTNAGADRILTRIHRPANQ